MTIDRDFYSAGFSPVRGGVFSSIRGVVFLFLSLMAVGFCGITVASGQDSSEIIDEGLEAVVLEVLSSNPAVMSALEDSQALDQSAKQARASTLPVLSLTREQGTRETERAGQPALELDETEQTLTITQPIFGSGSFFNLNNYKLAQAQQEGGYYTLKSVLNTASRDASQAYLGLIRASDALDNSRRNLSQIRGIAAKISAQARIDPGQRFQLFRAQNRLSLAEEEFINSERGLQVAFSRIANLLGHNPGKVPKKTFRVPDGLIPKVKEDAVGAALESHPDLLVIRQEVQRAKAERKTALGGLLPSVSYLYENVDAENLSGVESERSETFTGFSIGYSLSLAGGGFNQLGSADHRLTAAMQRQIDTERQVREEVEVAWDDYRILERRYQALVKFERSTKQERDAYNQQFSAGQRSLIELLNIEFEAFLARSRLVQGKFERDIASFNLLASMGQLTDVFINPEVAITELKKGNSLRDNAPQLEDEVEAG